MGKSQLPPGQTTPCGSVFACVCVSILRVIAALMTSTTGYFTRLGTTLRLYGCLKVQLTVQPDTAVVTVHSNFSVCPVTASSRHAVFPNQSRSELKCG